MIKLVEQSFARVVFLIVSVFAVAAAPNDTAAAESLTGIHSSRVMSQSMPWIAQETGLFKKYDIDFRLVYISSSPIVTGALLGGNGEVALVGADGIVRAYLQGADDLVFIGSVKNILTHSIVARPEIKRLEDLKGKKIGISRLGSNTHYFLIQALRRHGIDAGKDVTLLQSGGAAERVAAMATGQVAAVATTEPELSKAVSLGGHVILNGPELRIPYAAASFVTRRSIIAKRPQLMGNFMRAMAEAAKLLHSDRELVYRVLGKQLRINDRKILDAGYNEEIKALEPRLEIGPEPLQAILDETAKTDARAKRVKAVDLIDRRYLDELEKNGFMSRLWADTPKVK